MNVKFRSPLSKAKGAGASKDGVSHWWAQRFSAVILIPLVVWLVVNVLVAVNNNDYDSLLSPLNVFAITIFSLVSVFHGKLGMEVIIEDYVHCECSKYFLLIALKIVTYLTMAFGVFVLLIVFPNITI